MKLLIDMNLSLICVDFFLPSHIEAVHWSAIGATDAPDGEIMDYAANHGFAVFTHDLDFGFLLAVTRAGRPSVIQIRIDDLFPDSTATPIVSILRQFAAEIEQGALVTIGPNKTRMRMLPLNGCSQALNAVDIRRAFDTAVYDGLMDEADDDDARDILTSNDICQTQATRPAFFLLNICNSKGVVVYGYKVIEYLD
ncbi:MAG: DUF5615 family PIN-like protein [Spirochaetaceae bacterium]|jgi:predicted nuclease of predicted toxin-antitoxin system|nr:DUF5615 family PIN-like protein [Spirochaetaceae bacterium]